MHDDPEPEHSWLKAICYFFMIVFMIVMCVSLIWIPIELHNWNVEMKRTSDALEVIQGKFGDLLEQLKH